MIDIKETDSNLKTESNKNKSSDRNSINNKKNLKKKLSHLSKKRKINKNLVLILTIIFMKLVVLFLCLFLFVFNDRNGKKKYSIQFNNTNSTNNTLNNTKKTNNTNITDNTSINIITNNTVNNTNITDDNTNISNTTNITNNTNNSNINNTDNINTNIITYSISDYISENISDILICESGFFLTDNNICKKCSIDNCEKCSENNNTIFCLACMSDFIPIYENGIIKFCQYHCEIGKDEKCFSCDSENIICTSCNIGYKFLKGKCVLNNSFIAVYQTSENSKIELINNSYKNDILEMIIDGINVPSNYEYRFPYEGNHSVYLLLRRNISSLNNLFYSNKNIISITFSKYFDTKKIAEMANMFYNCVNLYFIDMTYFNTENVKDMSNMFYYCKRLNSINISNFNTQNVINMTNMFSNCRSLRSINLSNFDTKNVKDFSGFLILVLV